MESCSIKRKKNIGKILRISSTIFFGGFLIIRVYRVNPRKLETGLRTIRAGIPSPLPFRIEAIGFPTFGLRTSTKVLPGDSTKILQDLAMHDEESV